MKKLGKKDTAFIELYNLREKFTPAFKECMNKNIFIFPICIVDKSRWIIAIEFRDDDGGVLEYISSEHQNPPKFYDSKEEYEKKVMELYIHYSTP